MEKQGILCCTFLGSKLLLQKLITGNTKDNTGYLKGISNYCFSCICQHNNMKTKAKSVKYYIILRFSPNGTHDIFEKMNDTDFLVQSLVEIVKKQFQSKDVEYCIKFICCLTNLSNAGRQKVMAKHKSQKQKRAEWYKSLNPEEKQKLFSGRAEYNKTLDPADKDKIISHVQVNKEVHRNSVQHDLDHKITAFQSKIGKVHIIFSLFVTE